MRLPSIAALCFLCCGGAFGETVVMVVNPQEASRHVRVGVVLDRKPVRNTKVEFWATKREQTYRSAATNNTGIAKLPKLKPGDYCVAVKYKVSGPQDYVESDLYLHVSSGRKASFFSLDLTQQVKMARDQWAIIEDEPARYWLRAFQGTVQDPTGATIPAASIKIFKKGDSQPQASLKSDPNGHFSFGLEDRRYVTFFSSPGFRTESVPVEVTSGGESDLIVTLDVGRTN